MSASSEPAARHVGHVLFLAHVYHNVLVLGGLAHDHPLVHLHARADEQRTPVLRIKQAVAGRGARFVSDEGALHAAGDFPFESLIPVEDVV